jgi:hypothetical protein
MKTCKDFGMKLCEFCNRGDYYNNVYYNNVCWINYPAGAISQNLNLSSILIDIKNLTIGRHYLPYYLKGIEMHMPEIYSKLSKLLILL